MSALGKGVVFHSEETKDAELPSLEGAKVLLVEDNEINREFAVELLGTMGVEVSVAVDGEEGVAIFSAGEFDAILMDIQMPKLDGMEATRKIRQLTSSAGDRFATVPIIAMTAQAMAGDRDQALAAGMNDYVSKPIDPQLLAKALSRWLTTSEVTDTAPVVEAQIRRNVVPGALSSLTTINAEVGVDRIGGSETTFEKLLVTFSERYADAVKEIRELIDGNNLDGAEQRSHALKGVAGNLSADLLFEKTAMVDEQLKHHQLPSTYQLDELEKTLQSTIAEIESLHKQDQNEADVPTAVVDHKVLMSDLDSLRQAIDEDLISAQKQLESVQSRVAGSEFAEKVGQIAEQLDLFDIDAAKEVISELEALLG
ncbi:hypothetical protein BOW53_07570 [Solemya pervernicosa gill symbiont]|uniref:Response regulatory domain-containing protein n=1 Tax=Solemya pervernicosa gill symbiont TaxID=642797 RepID=A0A1T2L5X6_9GAMM|nr:response regulator [Solemya pervernicosa gill symbiont]OOZ40499.1 hypothetical protein BOW53_07570 [Solemya pervernicosa gill symbiont]